MLTLQGKPRLTRGKSSVEGERVLVWVDAERIVVEKAKGVIDPTLLKTLHKGKK